MNNIIIISIITLYSINNNFLLAKECISRDYKNEGTVCVCNSTYCDTIDPVAALDEGKYIMYTSNKAGFRFKKYVGNFDLRSETHSDNVITINTTSKFQTIFGFGGAFTDSAGININSLNSALQKHLMMSYFSSQGLEYSLCRVPMGGTDFSTRPYTYDDFPGDVTLEKFELASEDFKYKIPLMKEALSLRNGSLKFLATPWSAPAWMKTNDALYGFGFLHRKFYQQWADYYVKFLQAYEKENITFWGITTGNEPVNGFLPFVKINSMGWTPSAQSKWISNNLGPTIRNSNYKAIQILALDDQRFFLPWLPKQLFRNITTRNYVNGIAVHWYWDEFIPVSVLDATHNSFPEKFILPSEACVGDKFYQKSVVLGSWRRGEMYAEDIINDVNHWGTGWIDWNIALNEKGGPTYTNNFVDSSIIVNATAQEFYKNPMFYAIGHFSKFVPVNSKRIKSNISNKIVKVTAFLRPDNGIVVVIYNGNNYNVPVTLKDKKRGSFKTIVTQRSVNTIVYW